MLGVPEGAVHQWREAPLAVENQKGLTAHKLNKLHYFEHLRILLVNKHIIYLVGFKAVNN